MSWILVESGAMARPTTPLETGASSSRLARISRGDVLGLLPRGIAERGYSFYQERRISKIVWTGDDLESTISNTGASILLSWSSNDAKFNAKCSMCNTRRALCAHVAATLLQWIDIRPTMVRLGPGSIWRSHSRHPFLAPSHTVEDRVDLSHLTGVDLRSALELQLSLQRYGTSTARLNGGLVEITVNLPSGDKRVVFFSATVLPSALPVLRSLPRIDLENELKGLELSEARLQPGLTARWDNDEIVLEPDYQLADGTVFTVKDLEGRIHGRWARLGSYLCRVLDPATPLVPFHRKGKQVLVGRDALRFLNLDHPQLCQHSWYRPTGHLVNFRQPLLPKPCRLEAVENGKGKIFIKPIFEVDGEELGWPKILDLINNGFSRIGSSIVRAPDLDEFFRAGFNLPARGRQGGLVGDRIGFIRLVAETGLMVDEGCQRLHRLGALLCGTLISNVPSPPGLKSQLRPYQQDGVAWLWSRYQASIGALLADDMGLGKTHQIMGLLCLVLEQKPKSSSLVICPRGVLDHWNHLLESYAPHIKVGIFHGPNRSLEPEILDGGVTLTTYDIIFRSLDELKAKSWDIVVYDEAQRIKNPRTKAARAARKIPSEFRIALSGTPLENRLLELWSVIDLILPGFLGGERDFRTDFRNPSHHQLHRLRQRLSVLTLRRLKGQVLSDLPEKVEDIRYCQMSEEQLKLYQHVHNHQSQQIIEELKNPNASIPYMHIFALLTKLKQICDHPALVDHKGSSGKLEVFDQILEEALAGDHRVVVFSQYVKMIKVLSSDLERRDIPHLILTGESSNRGKTIRRFNSEQHERVLLASLLAGGVGIDLTGASVVIHYDRWWNPAKENQATDRVHRLGQKRFVQVFKLVTRSSIEERIDTMIRGKAKLFEEVVAPTEEAIKTLSRAEIGKLLDIRL